MGRLSESDMEDMKEGFGKKSLLVVLHLRAYLMEVGDSFLVLIPIAWRIHWLELNW